MRQESNQSPQDLSLKLYNIKQQKVTEHPQAHVVAANFKRQRYKQGGLRALGKEGYSQKNLLSGKANVSTSLQVVSKIKRKSGKKGLDYQKSKHTVCSGRHKQGQDVQLKRLGQTSHSGKSLQLKKVSEELKKQCLRRKRKRDEFDENDTFRIKKRVKYLINRMNKEQNLIDAYSTEGWKGQSREKLRPERELQKARSQILRLQLAIREAVKELDLLGSEGTMKEYIFNSYGQIYHEDIFCAICKRQDVMTNNDIILCDGACDRAFHQLCLEPALKTDEIPPDDEGWLCPVCECKSECLDAVNAYFGTTYGVEDPWRKIFSEAVSVGNSCNSLLPAVEDWPSDDSGDLDYVPGQDNYDSKLDFRDQVGSGGDSISLCSSDNNMSDSDTSASTFSKRSLLDELAEIMESENDCRVEVDLGVGNISNIEENMTLIDGKRQRKEVDYKKLHDEMFGKSLSTEEASEDEEWGPRKRLRKSRDDSQISRTRVKETNMIAFSSENLALTESSSKLQNKQRRVFLSPHAVEKLRAAFKENPLPSRACKEGLSKQLGLSFGRVHVWFKNVRCAALKKGLIQRARQGGKKLLRATSTQREWQGSGSLEFRKESGKEQWLILMDKLNDAQLKLDKLRSYLKHPQTLEPDSKHLVFVPVAELKEAPRP